MQTATEEAALTEDPMPERPWVNISALTPRTQILIKASFDSMTLVVVDPTQQLVRVRSTPRSETLEGLDSSQPFRLGCCPTRKYYGGSTYHMESPSETEWGIIREGGRLLLEGTAPDGQFRARTFGWDIEQIEVFPIPPIPPAAKPSKKADAENSD